MKKAILFKTIADARRSAIAAGYHISDGNKKLVPNEKTGFIVWNLPAVITCPYATKNCIKFCYARKAEKAYPDCLPARMDNFNRSRDPETFITFMSAYIATIAEKGKKAEYIVRIHESGDFYNQTYTNAWFEIIRRVNATTKKVKFIAYTKSFRFFDGVKLPRNFYLRASIWDDTKPEDRETIARNNWSIYTAVDQFRTGDAFTRCRCSDCATCGKCWSRRHDIRCEIH